MVNVIIIEVHTTYSWPDRTLCDTSEIALNIDHIIGVSASTQPEYPGSCILLGNNRVLLIAESEKEVQKKILCPHVVESDNFIMIEHWENIDDDRVWVSSNKDEDVYAATTSFDLWSRP
jgi:hypothetical protein